MIHCRNKIDYFPYIYYGFILIIFNNKKYKIIKIYKINEKKEETKEKK